MALSFSGGVTRHRFHFVSKSKRLSCKAACEAGKSSLLNVQTLRRFPKEKLKGEVVLVRFDSDILHGAFKFSNNSVWMAIHTIKYLNDHGAKVLLISDWDKSSEFNISTKSMADYLSSVLQLHVIPRSISSSLKSVDVKRLNDTSVFILENLTGFKQEVANSVDFAEKLSMGVGIYVNDAFSVSHKVLASTVGVTRFCYASLAGFKFEEDLSTLAEVTEISRRPYFAIVGGDNFLAKLKALLYLATTCDGLLFVGRIACQIMHALGLSDPLTTGRHGAVNEILDFLQFAKDRKLSIFLPVDFLCMEEKSPGHLERLDSDRLPTGWIPIGLGPKTLKEMSSMLSTCKKILWIGPVEFADSRKDFSGQFELAAVLEGLSRNGCDVVTVGSAACNAMAHIRGSSPSYKQLINASSVWDFLKGKTLPGLASLDRAFPSNIDWNTVFIDHTKPLVADIGSGNGMFLLNMAKKWKHLNFLGLESNKRVQLVLRCLGEVANSGIYNVHFVSTNATHTFRSMVGSYPGELVLVSIQCPNPDFNNARNRWRMVQRSLVEAIEDLLTNYGKIFLQSDVEEVATRMKGEFLGCCKKVLTVDSSFGEGWIKENPFGVRSDWEQHVLDRGAPMYRIMLKKADGGANSSCDALHLICRGADKQVEI